MLVMRRSGIGVVSPVQNNTVSSHARLAWGNNPAAAATKFLSLKAKSSTP